MAKLLSLHPDQAGSIVLVDDEAELVLAVGGMLRAEFGDARVRATSDAREASDWLREARPAVLITDVRMPDLTGLDLITQVAATWGPTATVVISAFPTDPVTVSARRSAVAYLPKPFEFAALKETVRGLLETPQDAFHGAVAVSTLSDILQLYAMSGATGLMAVSSLGRQGEVWFERGQVVHASSSGGAEGFESFRDQIGWPKGSFAWHPRRTPRRTIQMSFSALMMEAHRLNDEALEVSLPTRPPPAGHGLDAGGELAGGFTLHGVNGSEPSAEVGVALAPAPLPDLSFGGGATEDDAADDALAASTEPLLRRLSELDGFLSAAVVDGERDRPLGVWSAGDDPAGSTEGSAELVGLLRATVERLDLEDEIEDVVLTMGNRYQLIRPLRGRPRVFLYLALDRESANLAMARLQLAVGEHELVL